jgi:putative peptidoglycan lipid II flippase
VENSEKAGNVKKALASLKSRTVLMAALTVGTVSVGVKVLAVARDILAARRFGLGPEHDAYLVALSIILLGVSVIGGSVVPAFLPTYVRTRQEQGEKEASALLGRTLFWLLTLGLSASCVLIFLGEPVLRLLSPGFSAVSSVMARKLMAIMALTIPMASLMYLFSGVLNAGGKFAAAAAVPACTPLAVAGAVLLTPDSWGIQSMAWATMAGACLEVFVLWQFLRLRGISILPSSMGVDEPFRKVCGQYFPVAVGALLMSGAMVLDNAMATTLAGGSVTALRYGSKLVGFFLEIASLAVGTAVLPHFATLALQNDRTAIRKALARYSVILAAVAVPVALAMMVFSEPLTRILLERGSFSADNTGLVAGVQAMYALQIPFYILSILAVRMMSALLMNRWILAIASFNLLVKLGLNLLLYRIMGVRGLALSTTFVYAFSTILVYLAILWKTKASE